MPSLVQAKFQDGTEFRAFTQLEMREAFLDPFDGLSMTIDPMAHQVSGYRAHLLPQELVTIYVDGRVQFFGFIQTVEQTLSPDRAVSFKVSCFTPAKILTEADPDLTQQKSLSADRPLLELLAEAAKPFGLGVKESDHALEALKARTGQAINGTPTPVVKLKDSQPEDGDSVYSIVNKHASRLGVIIRCSPLAPDLYLSVPHYDTPAVATVRTRGDGSGPDGDYFFGEVRVSQSNEGQHSECIVYGETTDDQAATRSNQAKGRTASTDINSKRPPFRASKEMAYKPAIFTDKRATSSAIAKNVSKFFLGRAAREAFKVVGTVDGFVSRTGVPWTVDTVVRVFMPEFGIDEDMWISERTMSHSTDGQSTSLTLIPLGNLVLGEYSAQS